MRRGRLVGECEPHKASEAELGMLVND
jgi:hypothetical protein